jgi:hypothetical protein
MPCLTGLASHLRALKQGGPTILEGSGTDSTDNISANEDLGDRQTSQLSLGSGLTANPQQGRGVGSSIGRRLHQAADPSSMYKYAQQLVWGSVAGSWVGVDADSSGSKQHLQLGSSSMQQQGAVHHLVGGRCVTAGCAVASTAVAGTDAAATGAASSRDLVRSRRALLQGDSSQPGGMSDTATGGQRASRADEDNGLLMICLLDAA